MIFKNTIKVAVIFWAAVTGYQANANGLVSDSNSENSVTFLPQKIFFGSCSHQDKKMPILDAINAERPDLFLFLGDNVYGDTENMAHLVRKYDKLGAIPQFAKLRDNSEVMAIWDDHDFGENDAGKEYPMKEQSRQIMLDFWQAPKDSPRRTRTDGIYTSKIFGKGDKSIQIIMPDLRFNRDPINEVSTLANIFTRLPFDAGPYAVSDNPNASMLGEKQWQWLENELLKPSAIKVIASSLQLIPDFTGWESWANFPADRQRLFGFIKKHKINGVVIVSGDTHWGEMSRFEDDMDYPLWEVTSSGLTQEWKAVSPNKHRVGDYMDKVNYGELLIDWQQDDPSIMFGLKDVVGKVVMQQQFKLSDISPY